jgi:DNA-binding transcriptional ArsR family regulator
MPLQVIESTDSVAEFIRFQTSAVYETMISLRILLKPGRHAAWAAETRAHLPAGFWDELNAVYGPYYGGALFFELAVDYDRHNDVPGFLRYVRELSPTDFLFYLVGRIVPREALAATGLDPARVLALLEVSPFAAHCMCNEVPLEDVLADVPAFQARLVDLWEWYWESVFAAQAEELPPYWNAALADKTALLDRQGGMTLYEHVTGRSELMPPLPDEYPVTSIVFIPIYFAATPVYVFYGYGNITVLFDSESTEARRVEIEQHKESGLTLLKALGDGSRLDILRLIAHHDIRMNGKKIAAKLNLSASAVSRHLAQLRDAGLIVEDVQNDRTISYRLQRDVITALPDLVLDYVEH